MEIAYPKILLVTGSTINPYTGTGVLLSNLFKGWPVDKIAICYSDNFYHDKNICPNAYKIGEAEIDYTWPLNKLFGKLKSDQSKTFNIDSSKLTKVKNKLSLSLRLRDLYGIINIILGGDELYRSRKLSPQLLQWIRAYNPDVLYCHVSSLMNIRFILQLKQVLPLPLCIHIMDDWLGMRYKKGLLSQLLRASFKQAFKELLAQTTERMVIGEKMANFYEKKYGYSFSPFSNVLDLSQWRKEWSAKPKKQDGYFQIVYAGTINSKNVRSLEAFCLAINKLNLRGYNIQFKIFTFVPRVDQYRHKYEKKPFITMDEVPKNDEGMAILLQSANLLALPVDFTKVSVERMRYSMFAKIPAYMASGTPVLVYGPSDVASVEYALKEGWAYVVAKENAAMLEEAIIKLISDSSLRNRLVQKAQQIVVRDFDASKIRNNFQTRLADIAQK